MENYLTVKQVSSLLKMHWQTVLNYIKSGELEAIRLDKGYRISHDVIKAFAKQRNTKVQKR